MKKGKVKDAVLYDLIADIAETTDISHKQPDVKKQMMGQFNDWFASVKNSAENVVGCYGISTDDDVVPTDDDLNMFESDWVLSVPLFFCTLFINSVNVSLLIWRSVIFIILIASRSTLTRIYENQKNLTKRHGNGYYYFIIIFNLPPVGFGHDQLQGVLAGLSKWQVIWWFEHSGMGWYFYTCLTSVEHPGWA